MSEMLLVIGNKNYSSWSLRSWIFLKHLELPFREIVLPLETEQFESEIGRYSPTRRVPVLIDGQARIWESIAICEHAIERADGRGLPASAPARSIARSAAAEMHAGFVGIRSAYPMDVRARNKPFTANPELASSLARLDELWTECRSRFGGDGRWLFGDYSIADAMFAPIVLRLNTYGVDGLGQTSRDYVAHALSDRHLKSWMEDAAKEPWTMN